MRFTIRHNDMPRDPFGPYRYDIMDGTQLVAHYWHDHRGDDGGIELLDGRSPAFPFIGVTRFLAGGGPQSLRLTTEAIAYLETLFQ